MQLAPGTRIDRFKVLRYVATGGMAEIYLVSASGIAGFEKTLVLKRIRPDHANEAQFTEMFLDEARLAATLDHPNIVHVHDIGEESGNYFFTMEYVHGESVHELQKTLRRKARTLDLASALTIVSGAAAGLHYAHEKKRNGQPLGIVHRDVSPSNVLVTFDGGVKVVDFGIAKAIARLTETASGTVKGKYGYMSPEQCRGGEIDRRSDVFALGILLFELTTGHALFAGENEFEIVHKVCNEPVPRPSSRVADYPPELEAIVMRALERDPERRYATAQELQLALDSFARDHKLSLSAVSLAQMMREVFGDEAADRDLSGREVSSVRSAGSGPAAAAVDDIATVPSRPRHKRRWLPAAVAVTVVLGAGGAGIWALGRGNEPAAPATAAPPREQVHVADPPVVVDQGSASVDQGSAVVPPPGNVGSASALTGQVGSAKALTGEERVRDRSKTARHGMTPDNGKRGARESDAGVNDTESMSPPGSK